MTPHHVLSLRWVCAPVSGSTKFRLSVVDCEMSVALVFFYMSLITRVPGDMWVRMMSKSVSLSLCPAVESRLWFGGRCRRKATVLQCIVIRIHLAMMFVVSTSMYPRYNVLADTLSWLCSLHHCMNWSSSAKILYNLKKFMEDID